MKVYVDLVFFLNLAFDFLLLLTVKIVRKKEGSLRRIILASFVGGISIFGLFLPFNSWTLFLFKMVISFIMVGVAYGIHEKKEYVKDLVYLYFVSILLGGFLYYLNMEFSYQNVGLIFFHNGFSINFILLFILGPIILFLYIKQVNDLKKRVQTYYTFSFIYGRKKYHYLGFLDTGNQLVDPYKKRPVILIYDPKFHFLKSSKFIYVPYRTLDHQGVIPCSLISKFYLDDREIEQEVLIGLSKEKFHIEGAQVILHPDIFSSS